MTLSARLERAFASRLVELPEGTRMLVLAGALDGDASLEELSDATTRIHGDVVPLDALGTTRLVGSGAGTVELAVDL
jgi:hypothetical protein